MQRKVNATEKKLILKDFLKTTNDNKDWLQWAVP